VKARASRKSIRIWWAADFTGQEPYSLAMCLKEISAELAGRRGEILATDLSREAIVAPATPARRSVATVAIAAMARH
jgi:chemotaxis protein methyltransferase CheR